MESTKFVTIRRHSQNGGGTTTTSSSSSSSASVPRDETTTTNKTPIELNLVQGLLYDDWNALGDVQAEECPPQDDKSWPVWKIVRHHCPLAQTAWYDVERVDPSTTQYHHHQYQHRSRKKRKQRQCRGGTARDVRAYDSRLGVKTTAKGGKPKPATAITRPKKTIATKSISKSHQKVQSSHVSPAVSAFAPVTMPLAPPVTMHPDPHCPMTYLLHFPPFPGSLGLVIYQNGDKVCLEALQRLCTPLGGVSLPPQKGDIVKAIDKQPVTQLSFQQICQILTNRDVTQGTVIVLERGSVITMTASSSASHDYVLTCPPSPDGGRLILRKEAQATQFAKLWRPLDARDNLTPPKQGDVVTMINGQNVATLGYDKIVQKIKDDGGRPVEIGFRRQTGKATSAINQYPVTTKALDSMHYLLEVPLVDSKLGMRISANNNSSFALLEKLDRPLTENSNVEPKKGDIIMAVDGVDVLHWTFPQIVEMLGKSQGKDVRVLRLQKSHAGNTAATMQSTASPFLRVPPSDPQNFTEFDAVLTVTHPRGLGLQVNQVGGKAVVTKLCDFAVVKSLQNLKPAPDDEIVAIDEIPVTDCGYLFIIDLLKKHGEKSERHIRFRRYKAEGDSEVL